MARRGRLVDPFGTFYDSSSSVRQGSTVGCSGSRHLRHLLRTAAVCALLLPLSVQSQPQIFRCTQPDGKVTLSDKECDRGARREGHGWVDVEEDRKARALAERQRTEAEDRRRRLEQQKAEREADRLVAERHAESDRRKAAAAAGVEVKPFESTSAKVDRMTSYATIIGRAIGCGVDTAAETRRVGLWLDATFTGEQRKVYLPTFAAGMKMHAQAQRAGSSPDSCATVRDQFARVHWP